MLLYNSATHKKEEFVPNHPDIVKMYTCSPAVYTLPISETSRSYIRRTCWRSSCAMRATTSSGS